MVFAVEFYIHVNTHPERIVLDVEFHGARGKKEVDVQRDAFVERFVETAKTDSKDGHGDAELAFLDIELYRDLLSVRTN